MMKKMIKAWVPPFFLTKYHAFKSPWQGVFASWDEAKALTQGYDDDKILKRVTEATQEVVAGRKIYERDSVLFDEVLYSWPLVAALQETFIRDGYLNVLDFGGSLGSSYYQNRAFLNSMKGMSWNIVEQEIFVGTGKKIFQNEKLFFHGKIADVVAEKKINFVLVSSVLQYLEFPYKILEELLEIPASSFFLDRLSVIDSPVDVISVQKVPEEIYPASYPCWFFCEDKIKKIISEKFELIAEFKSFIPNEGVLRGRKFHDKGFFFARINDKF